MQYITLLQAQSIIRRYRQQLLQMPNVTGIAVSVQDGQHVIVLLLEKKPQPGDLPLTLNGVAIRYRVVGRIGMLEDRRSRVRPAFGGISVGHPKISAGTLGAVVSIRDVWYIISNNHIIANTNDGRRGDPIIQPGTVDGGTVPNDVIAYLHSYYPIKMGGPGNLLDFAIAEVAHPQYVQDIIMGIPPAARVLPPREYMVEPAIGMVAIKSGRTTGKTSGVVDLISVDIKVRFGILPWSPWALFVDQFAVAAVDDSEISDPGDSGSVVLNDGGKLMGMLFAGPRDRDPGEHDFFIACKANHMLDWIHEEFNFRPGVNGDGEIAFEYLPLAAGIVAVSAGVGLGAIG